MASHIPGSRAIRIPLASNRSNDHTQSVDRRKKGLKAHITNPIDPADSSDAGPSSLGSDPDSSWSSSSPATVSPGSRQLRSLKNSIASPANPVSCHSPTTPDRATHSRRKDKQKAGDTSPPSSTSLALHSPLGHSMLHSSSYKSVNLNSHRHRHNDYEDPDEPPRLITYTKHSQGFVWNDEIFLPSYLLGRRYYGDDHGYREFGGDQEQCPVAEIFVTDEEAEAMMP